VAEFLATLESWLADPWIGGIAGGLLGTIVGSFLATLLIRWPQEQSALGGRSACDSCDAPLGARDLIPMLSFVIARGRCRHCGAPIDARHLGMELAAALAGAAAFVAHGWPLGGASALLGWWLLLIIALDVEHQWLPDRLTLPLIPLGLGVAWLGLGPPLLDRAIGAAAGGLTLALIALLYRAVRGRDGLGGGDPKLLAGLGAWLGWMQLPFLLLGAGLGGLVAAAIMQRRGRHVHSGTRLPLGALLALVAWPLWLVAAPH
jgi:leader peptidase (prepilin peptidase)/N-methyltransferase